MKNFKWANFMSLMILLFLPAQGELSEERIKGFSVDSSKEERQMEAALKKLADPKVYEKHLRFLTEEPHIAGTKRNYDLAVYIRDKFKEFGLEDAELVEYQVLLSYPKEIIVEMVEPLVFKATLREEGYPVDKDSFDSQVSIGFNAYSASGEVTAPVVYAHGGNPEDYDRLLEMGIDISRNQKEETGLIETRVGSGSDHTAFLNFVCMPILGMGFDGPYGVYHSQYDDFYWMSHFGDPQFSYHATLATLWGMTTLRLANAQIYPFDYEAYAGEIGSYVKEILSQGEKPVSPDLNLLVSRIEDFQKTARELNRHIERFLSQGSKTSSEILQAINSALMQIERDFGFSGGIPKRPWYKHLIYACKFTYDPEVLPGVTEAVEEKDWARAKEQISLLDKAVSLADRTLQEVLIRILENQKGE
jgi:hypothetical protein